MSDLKVYMLGKFSMVYGEQPVIFKRNSATKVLKAAADPSALQWSQGRNLEKSASGRTVWKRRGF